MSRPTIAESSTIDYPSLRLAHYAYFFMYAEQRIDEFYRARLGGVLPMGAYLLKFFRSLVYIPWSLRALFPPRGRIICFFVSKNNLDALRSVHEELGSDALLLTTEYEFRDQAVVMPMFLAFVFSLFRFPKLLRFYVSAPRHERKILAAFGNKMLLSLGYHMLCRLYLRIASPRAIVFTNDHVYENRILVELAEARGISCFYLQHSTAYDNVPRIFSSYALLEGQHAREKYLSVGSDDRRIKLVGMPKFDDHILHVNRGEAVNRLGICTNRSMPAEVIAALVSLVTQEFPELEITLRPHPSRESEAKYRDIVQRWGLAFSDSKRVDVFTFLRGVDAIVAGNSSILLEAALLNVFPIYYFDSHTEFFYNHDRYDKYDYVRNRVACGAEGMQAVCEILRSLALQRPSVRGFAQYYCATLDTPDEGKSSALAASVICDLV